MDLQDEKIFKKALELQNAERYTTSLKILHGLETRNSKFSPLFGVIGKAYYLIEDFKNSKKYFRKTLKLNPNSELASLGLYHSLIELGKIKEAFLEMDRFLNSNKAKLYKVAISELNENIKSFKKSYQQDIIRKHS